MVKVPEPIERLFDTVPISSYPKEEVVDHVEQFFFEGDSHDKDSFTLGVHQVVQLTGSDHTIRLIPNDPISLGYALWLAHKNGLKLPTTTTTSESRSNNSIIQLSFHAAPDQQLPILIEDSNDSRNIISLTSLSKADKSNIEAKLINDLLDSKFVDLWILCLLNEHPQHIFKDENDDDLFNLNKYHNYLEIPNWKAFKIRYPNLFETPHSGSIKTFYKSELKLFNQNLSYFSSEFASLDIQLKLKLIGYVIIFDKFLPNTEIGAIIKNYPELVKSSYKLLEKY